MLAFIKLELRRALTAMATLAHGAYELHTVTEAIKKHRIIDRQATSDSSKEKGKTRRE